MKHQMCVEHPDREEGTSRSRALLLPARYQSFQHTQIVFLPHFRALLYIIHSTQAGIVPMYLDLLFQYFWRIMFSFSLVLLPKHMLLMVRLQLFHYCYSVVDHFKLLFIFLFAKCYKWHAGLHVLVLTVLLPLLVLFSVGQCLAILLLCSLQETVVLGVLGYCFTIQEYTMYAGL